MAVDADVTLNVKGTVEKLELSPGDKLVVKLDISATSEVLEAIKGQLEERFPDNEILVIDRGVGLTVVKDVPVRPPTVDEVLGMPHEQQRELGETIDWVRGNW
jgi:hypothetical protein